MTPTLRKRLLIGAGGVVGLLIVALLAAPSLIDVNSFKPEIVAQVKKATGRDLVIDGPIGLSLLPTPTVTVAGVRFFNVPGSKNPNMVEMKSVTATLSVGALLTGGIEVSEVFHLGPDGPASGTGNSRPPLPRPGRRRARRARRGRCRSAGSPSRTAR